MAVKSVLIEEWLPIQELGIESRRERGAASALPPLSFLHVWWARRPIVASSAVVLCSLLPTWSKELETAFPDLEQVRSLESYKKFVFRLIGIWGDPITARKAFDEAVISGIRVANPFTYKQAFRNIPDLKDMDCLEKILIHTWGELPTILDPTAGGGSIPFAASKLRIPTISNDLNGVAAAVLTAGVSIPGKYSHALLPAIQKWSQQLIGEVSKATADFYPKEKSEETILTYLFANSVVCPRSGRLVPLIPDKWLRKVSGAEAAVRILIKDEKNKDLQVPRFVISVGSNIDATDADKGTVKRGEGISPYDNLVIDGDYIKAEAQNKRITPLLYAVVIRDRQGNRQFRAPTEHDYQALENAAGLLRDLRPQWEALGFLPTEEIPVGLKTSEPIRYGITKWSEMFTDRQLLAHGIFAREFAELIPRVMEEEPERGQDILTEIALIQGKALNYNSKLSSWHVNKQVMRSVFDRHDFAFKWTFAEFGSAEQIYQWGASQLEDSYLGICRILDGMGESNEYLSRSNKVFQGSAANMPDIATASIAHICIDPPYFDNVMYAELADFFYVWEKRTLGRVRKDFFPSSLSEKSDEAVANSSRFESAGRRKNELAELDYKSKMTAIFAESRRVLRDDGVMSVMFTHKKAEAWDSLGTGLLEAGFTIETSWPVNTEAEHSLHQANMNSAASTIMLVCRKRQLRASQTKIFLEDIADEVRGAAREAVKRFEKDGILGVDLLLSTYGPTLAVISRYWPVYSSTPDDSGKDRLLRPEEALNLAREELVNLRQSRLVGHAARLDELTDFVVIAWDTFKAREFSFDTARLLALAIGGLDIDTLVRQKIVEKSAGKVRLLLPQERLRKDSDGETAGVRLEQNHFNFMIDAIDTVLFIAQEDGMAAAKRFLDQSNLLMNENFRDAVQALVNAIPRTFVQGNWIVPEAGLLDILVTAFFPEINLPAKEEIKPSVEVPTLFDVAETDSNEIVD